MSALFLERNSTIACAGNELHRVKPLTRPQVLIISEDADEYARHLESLSVESIPLIACHTAEEAQAVYSGQTILFGEPNLIAEVIDSMPGVQWVQSTWAGVKPLLALHRADFVLTGVKGVFGQKMSEYALGYMLAHELKVFQRVQSQQRGEWDDTVSGSLCGKSVGIMGTGSIGSHLAAIFQSFGMHITGLNRSGKPVTGFERVFPAEHIISFLSGLDYLISVLPDTSATNHMLNPETFRALPKHAVLINIGRGNVVDYSALIKALHKQELAGAVLDVFEQEPLPSDSALWNTPNLLITAHVAADSQAADIAPEFIDNYQRFLDRQPLKFVIDFSQGY